LYGPCVSNQIILGKWRKLYKVINSYLSEDMGYYIPNTTELRAKLKILHQSTILLLALVDVEDPALQQEIIENMIGEIDLKNLKGILVDIFKYKIGGNQERLRYYFQGKVCDHAKYNSLVRVNYCEEDEFCEKGFLLPFDKQTIASGFNIFVLLMRVKEIKPAHKDLADFEFDIQKSLKFYNKKKDQYMERLKQDTKVSPVDILRKIKDDEIQRQEEMQQKAEMLIEELTVIQPSRKMFKDRAEDDEKKREEFLDAGIDEENEDDDIDNPGDSQQNMLS